MVEKTKNFYEILTKYSITLNPVDKHQYFGKLNRLRLFQNFLYEQLITFKGEYEVFIELSEPHSMKTQGYSGPRLHAHGYILFRTRKELSHFLLLGYYKLTRWTSVDIDTISDFTKWHTYYTKQHLIKHNRYSNFDRHIDLIRK